MDKPRVVYKSDSDLAAWHWTTCINSIQAQLKLLEEFLDMGVDGLPEPGVIAALQDRFDQIGERLWRRSEQLDMQASQKQESTESLTATETPSAME